MHRRTWSRAAWRGGWRSAVAILGVLAHAACGDETIVAPPLSAPLPPAISGIELAAVAATEATIAFSTDRPTVSRVEYGTTAAYGTSGALDASPTLAHTMVLTGLTPATTYHYRVTARDARGHAASSEGHTLTTPQASTDQGGNGGEGDGGSGSGTGTGAGGIWISPAEVAELPTSGAAWDNLLFAANGSCGVVNLADQEQTNNVCIMAKALVFARTGTASYRTDVVAALTQVVNSGVYGGRALALGRELAAYVIAADLVGLNGHDAALDVLFRTKIRALLTVPTTEAGTLQQCHEQRPNNWGTHCGASRAAVAAYLGDTAELDRVATVFRGWLGDRAAYVGFSYGDLSWQCDPAQPVGINPAGCTRNGASIDGVIADDQRRAGGFVWPAPRENYVWEALQGALVQAVILDRAGYPAWDWQDRALLRAVTWLHGVNGYPAEGEDTWQAHVVNHYYGTDFPAPIPARAGKNVGWTDWTHR